METISGQDLLAGLSILSDPMLLFWIVGGVLVGMVFGAAPGLTATAGVAIATPLTFGISFQESMALLLGIYSGGYFAGSIPAILVNTPGAPGNAATSLDGYALAKKGQADLALSLAVVSSFIGGVMSTLVLLAMAPTLASFALHFTAVEYAVFGLFGLVCVAAISGGSLIKGGIAAVLGMFLGCVGIDPVGGAERLTLGIPSLLGGVPLIPALIAFFAITEMLAQGAGNVAASELPPQAPIRISELVPLYLRNKWLTIKSSLIGTFIGILPGTGPTIASWISYSEAARGSTDDDRLGDGSPRGIIAAETANNAVTGGAMVPLLTLGIPGDTVTAVLLGALLIQGIDPGPFFIAEKGDLFTQIMVILLAGNLCILLLGLVARRFLPAVLRIPQRILIPIIGVLCATGAFAVNNSPFDVGLVAVLGVAGYVLLRFGVPMAPMVLGLVLGPIIESNLRDALTVHHMDLSVFLTRPISACLLVGIGMTIFFSWRQARSAKGK